MDQNMHRLVHLDLKGAAPTMQYLEQLLPLLRKMGATGLLVEYEDMFPYWGNLDTLRSKFAYSKEDIGRLLELASSNNLIVIPLVQTFGHFEFVLKHTRFAHLREMRDMPMALCPTNPDSFQVVCEMLKQVLELHPTCRWFHIGCDEVYHMGCCQRCREQVGDDAVGPIQLFYSHVKAVGQFVRSHRDNITPIIWDDMLRLREADELRASGLGSVVEIMVWHYLPIFQLPPDLWTRLSAAFPSLWVASAFKGATSASAVCTDVTHHVSNHLAWLSVLQTEGKRFKHVQGIALTGWQRFDHFAVLCEVLPQALPCLALCLQILQQKEWTSSVHRQSSEMLKFSGFIPTELPLRQQPPACDFPGSAVYVCMLEFAALAQDFRENFYGDKVFTWTHPYLMERMHCNPLHVDSILNYLYYLLMRFADLRGRLVPALESVFFPDMVTEWLGVYLDPKVRQLEELAAQAEAFLKAAKEAMALTPPDQSPSPAGRKEKQQQQGEEGRRGQNKLPWPSRGGVNNNNNNSSSNNNNNDDGDVRVVDDDEDEGTIPADSDSKSTDSSAGADRAERAAAAAGAGGGGGGGVDVNSDSSMDTSSHADTTASVHVRVSLPCSTESEAAPAIQTSASTAVSRPTASLPLQAP